MISRTITLTETRVLVYGPKIGSNWIYIRAQGNDCFIGGNDVTDLNGLKIINTETLAVFVERGEQIYGVSKSGVHSLTILEPSSA